MRIPGTFALALIAFVSLTPAQVLACRGGSAPAKEMHDPIFDKGRLLENQNKIREAIAAYRQSFAKGNGWAAKALGDIYAEGKGTVAKDYAESLRWYQVAEKMGISMSRC